MDWIESESLWFFCPDLADVFVWREPSEYLQSPPEIVGADEVVEVLSKLSVVRDFGQFGALI